MSTSGCVYRPPCVQDRMIRQPVSMCNCQLLLALFLFTLGNCKQVDRHVNNCFSDCSHSACFQVDYLVALLIKLVARDTLSCAGACYLQLHIVPAALGLHQTHASNHTVFVMSSYNLGQSAFSFNDWGESWTVGSAARHSNRMIPELTIS
jgi:hypothetical protein